AITTAGGNKIHIEDKTGTERILMHSPNQKSFVRIGAPNDPSISTDEDYDDGFSFIPGGSGVKEATDGYFDVLCGLKNEFIFGDLLSVVIGERGWWTIGLLMDMCFGGQWEFTVPYWWKRKNLHMDVNSSTYKIFINKTRTGDVERKFAGQTNDIRAYATLGVNDKVSRAATEARFYSNKVDANARTVNQIGAAVNTMKRDQQGVVTSMDTMATQLRSSAEWVDRAGAAMVQLGNGVENAGQETSKVATALRTVAMSAEAASGTIKQV
ncbi:MAG: hypothetical protein ABFD12_07765, partial [Syntrophorhabdus sp.]